jgi:hypothetical protein
MKNVFSYIILIISFSCSTKSEELNADLNGIWKRGANYLLVLDSVMTHPYYDFPGFYHYQINDDSLVVFGNVETQFNRNQYIKINSRNDSTFELIRESDTLHYVKVDLVNPVKNIKELTFESGFGEGGRMPIFKMTLDHTGKVVYEGESFSSINGRKEYYLDTAFISQLNQILHHIDVDGYPKNELLPPPGSPRQDLHIEYMNGQKTNIDRGLFQGEYYFLVKIFWLIETLLE